MKEYITNKFSNGISPDKIFSMADYKNDKRVTLGLLL